VLRLIHHLPLVLVCCSPGYLSQEWTLSISSSFGDQQRLSLAWSYGRRHQDLADRTEPLSSSRTCHQVVFCRSDSRTKPLYRAPDRPGNCFSVFLNRFIEFLLRPKRLSFQPRPPIPLFLLRGANIKLLDTGQEARFVSRLTS
jgi:hypothetical protein